MARARNHRTTYQRRNELARERGYKSYSEQRKIQEKTRGSFVWENADLGEPSMGNAEDRATLLLFKQAFFDEPDNYATDSPKAKWFVEIAGIITQEEWLEHYPNGIREYIQRAA